MAKRVTEGEKKEILKSYNSGLTIKEISVHFKFTENTVKRHLKKILKREEIKNSISKEEEKISPKIEESDISEENSIKQTNNFPELITESFDNFYEISPLESKYNFEEQKDVSSVQISEVVFPKVVYMILDKTSELEIKKLNDYPQWQFLSQNDLKRNTIEIFEELKVAKRSCNNNQKVIKVPNTNVFKIVKSILLSKGITRIISDRLLISL